MRVLRMMELPRFQLTALMAFAAAFYGHALSFGLVYDDRILFAASHARWFHAPWECSARVGTHWIHYYRPLQAMLFAPAAIASWPILLHLQNIIVGSLLAFMFLRLLVRLGFSGALALVSVLVGLAMPTSMMLFVWISQRVDWIPMSCVLATALIAHSNRAGARLQVLGSCALGALALLGKESGISVIALAPLFLYNASRRARAFATAVLGACVFVAYCWLRWTFVPGGGLSLRHLLPQAAVGTVVSLVLSWLPLMFTRSPIFALFALVYGACAIMGAESEWRRDRRTVVTLILLYVGCCAATALGPVPRNLEIPGMVLAAFACAGAARLVRRASTTPRALWDVLAFAISTGALAMLSIVSSYPLQDWIEPINARLESTGYAPRRGWVHVIDVNIPAVPAPDSTSNR